MVNTLRRPGRSALTPCLGRRLCWAVAIFLLAGCSNSGIRFHQTWDLETGGIRKSREYHVYIHIVTNAPAP